MNTQIIKNRIYIEKITGIAIFTALARIVTLLCKPIPQIQNFLAVDLKSAVIVIASFIYGPIPGVIIALLTALIEMITISDTGLYGFVMDFASAATFVFVSAFIYKYFRNINGVIIAFMSAIFATTGVMLLLNKFVTPLYLSLTLGMPPEVANSTVISLLPTVLLPFNAFKTALNAGLALMLYKPLLAALSKAGIVTTKSASLNFNRNTVIIIIVGSVLLVASIIALFIIA